MFFFKYKRIFSFKIIRFFFFQLLDPQHQTSDSTAPKRTDKCFFLNRTSWYLSLVRFHRKGNSSSTLFAIFPRMQTFTNKYYLLCICEIDVPKRLLRKNLPQKSLIHILGTITDLRTFFLRVRFFLCILFCKKICLYSGYLTKNNFGLHPYCFYKRTDI